MDGATSIIAIIVPSALSALATILVAYIGYKASVYEKAADKRQKEAAERDAKVEADQQARAEKEERRAMLRAEESRLQMQMLHADMKLSVGTAMAVKNGHCNGELEAGLQAVVQAEKKYNDFLASVAYQQLNK